MAKLGKTLTAIQPYELFVLPQSRRLTMTSSLPKNLVLTESMLHHLMFRTPDNCHPLHHLQWL
jgi:hypothetical protein